MLIKALILLTLFFNLVTASEILLEYKPFKHAVYSIYMMDNSNVASLIAVKKFPIIISLKEKQKNEFKMLFSKPDSILKPPNDLLSFEALCTSNGFEFEKNNKQLKFGPGITDKIIKYPVLDNKRIYNVGDEFVVKTKMPICYSYSSTTECSNEKIIEVEIKQKIVKIEDMLGFTCAKIEYSIEHVNEIGGSNISLLLKGVVHFSISYGLVVYDKAKSERVIYYDNELKKVISNRKIRLLKVDPF